MEEGNKGYYLEESRIWVLRKKRRRRKMGVGKGQGATRVLKGPPVTSKLGDLKQYLRKN